MGHFLLHLLQVDILVGMTIILVATHINPNTSPTNQANPIMDQINLTINLTSQTSLTTNQM
jgi:hypothetical protein